MKKLYFSLVSIICILFCGHLSYAQLTGTDIFLPGHWLEIGQNNNGSFGSLIAPPAGYFPFPAGPLAEVYDFGHDGWTTGAPPYFGDYTYPGSPYEGWGIQVGGVGGLNWTFTGVGITGAGTLTGSNTSYVNAGGRLIGNWSGIADTVLQINMETRVDTNASWVVCTVYFHNISGAPLNNIYYVRSCDPDNDETRGGSFTTSNVVNFQNDVDHRVSVSADGETFTNAYLQLCTKDCRAKAFAYTNWPLSTYVTDLSTVYSGTAAIIPQYSVGIPDVGDISMGLVYNIGTINAGDSAVISYAYSFLNTPNGVDSAFPEPALVVNSVTAAPSGPAPAPTFDTFYKCAAGALSTIPVSIANAGDKCWTWSSWSWAPAIGLATTTGLTNTINLTAISTITTYTITGTDSSIDMYSCNRRTFYLTIDPSAPAITPATSTVCIGGTVSLTDGSAGGTWSSTNTAVGTVSSTGVVTGVSLGTTTISYLYGTCAATAIVTVNGGAGVITPSTASVCVHSTVTLTDATGGGTWGSSNTGVATVSGGVVTGVSSGSATISYSSGSCFTTATVTVNISPSVITGLTSVCVGDTIFVSDSVAGGVWTSSNTSVATTTLYSPGQGVFGISAGTTTISYTIGSCSATLIVTVNTAPNAGAITGPATVCVGSTIPLTDTVSGGIWTSGNTSLATVGSTTGIVIGLAPGFDTITYTVTNACGTSSTRWAIVVLAQPAPITGTSVVCVGSTTNLSDATGGGTWASSNSAIAAISSAGIVTGISYGTANITYTSPTSCFQTLTVTVNIGPSVIDGTKSICLGATTTLTDSVGGGTWFSGNTSVATVGSGSGVVTGIGVGTATISYYIGTSSCIKTTVVTVDPNPAAILPSGPVTICLGGTASLSDVTSGGTWSSSSSSVATVGTSGIVTGMGIGTANISYTLAGGCAAIKTVTVNAGPSAITPHNPSVCVGSTLLLSDATGGGTWSSTVLTVATISTSGLVTGVGAGITEIFYTIGSCIAKDTVTVLAGPAAITPVPATICLGGTTTLTDATSGGTWSSSNSGVASVGTGLGVVTGNTVGTATISYTVGSCSATTIVTVNNGPGAILPPNPTVCTGSTITLTDATGGGAWSSGAPGTATVTGGVVTGVAAGTARISYSIGTCSSTTVVTVNPTPSAINPAPVTICLGGTASLTDATASGAWSSSASGTASITSGGVVTGNAVGTATISYTVGSCSATTVVTVNNAPTAILPPNPTVCTGGTTTLTDATGGGVWSSGAPGTATVVGGVVTGVSVGTATISYSIGTCSSTTVVTVNPTPSAINPAPVTICLGGTASLTDATASGAWSSSASGTASITSGGVVTGNTVGTATISYTVGSCSATTVVTVNSAPAAILPPNPTVCTGGTTTLTDATGGGVWSSGAPANATVAGGVVTGVAVGTATISYSIGTCSSTTVITINPTPSAINPVPVTICLGGNITLTDATSGGAWSSSASGIASITGGGVVTGNAVGTATIFYTVAGCAATTVATVNTAPGTILPLNPTVCTGSTITLTDATAGGVWSSATPWTATVSGGVVTGVAAGTASISYSIGTCSAATIVTIDPTPSAITPVPATVCLGGTTSLTDATAGGAWSSSASGIASVSAGGVVTGNTIGTATVFYTLSGCSAATVVTVNTAPGAILPPNPTVCTGSTITLTDATGGGVWSSSAPGTATVAGGLVTGVTAGTAVISYAIGSCAAATTITVNLTPAAITPTPVTLCIGSTATVTDATAGGAWSSSASGIASITAGGVITGNAVGTATIFYTVGSCASAIVATVNTTPGNITPVSPAVCLGGTTTLTDAIGGGAWSSSAGGTAAISTTGVVTGIATGTATISYAIGACVTTTTITVNPVPSAINPSPASVCLAGTITLTDATGGGVWSSSAPGTASITVGGVVTGNTVGTATIAYTNGFGCAATEIVTVTTLGTASTILGPLTICQGSFDIYIDYTPGGVWSMSSGLGVISSVGVVDALSAGTVDVIYTVTNACGSVSTSETITIVPSSVGAGAITGASNICVGSSITLSDASAPGGTWSRTNGHASVGSATGIVTGMSGGLDTIIYSVTTVCGTYTTSATVMVDASATPAPITGPASVCIASNITLSDADLGGVWSSSNANATVVLGTGVVTGITAGLDTIKYTVVNGCGLGSGTKVIDVLAAPGAGTITGPSSVCPASTIVLTDAVGGGTWSAANGNALTGSTGHVLGITAGLDTIVYTINSACGLVSTTKTVTINPLPDAGTITGPDSVCVGSTINLTDLTAGGVWSTGNANASVGPAGVVTGVSVGTVPVSYDITNSCGTTYTSKIITVSTLADPGVITGISNVCVGSAITLTDTAAGGIWLAANGTAMLIGPGIVQGVSPGIDSIFYVVINSCGTNEARKIIDINPVPVIPAISGPASQCVGTIINLTDLLSGGDWTSSDATIASVGLASGSVTGVSAGIITITYTTSNVFGCSSFVTSPDTVNVAPSVSIITGLSAICLGSTVALTDLTSGGIWSSSNTGVATVDASGNVTDVGTGTSTITYSVTGICGAISATQTETVNPLPVIAPVSGATSACAGTTTTLTDATTGGVWSSSDTTVATIDPSTGVLTGVAPGVINILYSVTNGFGCSSSVSTPFTVNALPAVAAITGTTNECISFSSDLFDVTPAGTWSSSDNTIATVDPVTGKVLGISGGIVTIYYTVTNAAGCNGVAATPDTVNTTPVSAPITGASGICAGLTTTLSNAVLYGVWTSSNTSIATIDPATGVVTGISAGVDNITYTVTNSCGSVTDATTITVNAIPVVAPITAAYATVCAGTSVTLSDITAGGTWISINTAVATVSTTGVVTGVTTGVDTIMYVLTNSSGCSGEATYVVTFAPALPAITVVPGSATLCHGSAVNMHTSAVIGGLTYQWLLNGNVIAGATNSNYTADSAGNYSLVISNGLCSETLTGPVVSAQPHAVISFTSPDILYTGSYYSYQWYKNGILIPGATGSVLHETGPGLYTVVVTDMNGCSDTSSGYTVHTGGGGGGGGTGVSNTPSVTDIKVYPNPATSVLTIDAPQKVNVTLLSVDGKSLIEQNNATTIDISILPNGLYLLMIYDENNLLLMTTKFVKTAQ